MLKKVDLDQAKLYSFGQCCGAWAGRSRGILAEAGDGLIVRLRLQITWRKKFLNAILILRFYMD